MKKKKILIASYNLDLGGIETSLINLIRNISLDKYEVTLILEHINGILLDEIPKEVILKEYKVSENKIIFIRKFLNLLKEIRWIMFNYKRYYSSICYATYSGPCGFLTRTSSKNKILFVHSNYYELFNKNKEKTKTFFDNLKITKYNHIIFVSNESRKDLCNIYPDIFDKSITINNIVDYEKIIDLSKEEIDLKKTSKKTFLFLGRLEESSKRITLLLDVAKKCQKEKLDYTFWIVGTGPDEKLYKDIVKNEKIKNVLFLGMKKNPYPYLKACDYLLLTSRYEGFPVVYNEAIILKKPIITTIDVSDDYISIPNRFGIIVNEENIYEVLKSLPKDDYEIKENINYKLINEERIRLIEKIMESQ